MFENNRKTKNIVLLLLIVLYIFVYKIFIFNNFMKYSSLITASFLVLLFGLSIKLLGFRKDKMGYMDQNMIRVVILYLGVTFLIMYGLGFFVGFLKNAYSSSLSTLLDNIFAPIVIILLCEGIRYVGIWANRDRKLFICVFTVVLAFFEIAINVRGINFGNLASLFQITATIVLPAFIKNCVMSYLCYHSGYRVPIFYRLVMDVYYMVIPIIPNIGEYLTSMILIAIPLVIYIHCFTLVDERVNKVEHVFKSYQFSIWDIPITFLIIVVAALISGFFPHYMIGIGSSSMQPAVNRGDAVVIRKLTKNMELKENDIIAYKKDKIVVVHRIHEIKSSNGVIVYVTKGDANNGVDTYTVSRKEIKGIIRFKVPYIAYPTVWLSEQFNKYR